MKKLTCIPYVSSQLSLIKTTQNTFRENINSDGKHGKKQFIGLRVCDKKTTLSLRDLTTATQERVKILVNPY